MIDSLQNLPPGLIMVLGALLLPLLGGRLSAIGALVLSLASAVLFWFTPDGNYGNIELFGETLNMVRIDAWSRIFGVVFHSLPSQPPFMRCMFAIRNNTLPG